jgi:hypothetical protein
VGVPAGVGITFSSSRLNLVVLLGTRSVDGSMVFSLLRCDSGLSARSGRKGRARFRTSRCGSSRVGTCDPRLGVQWAGCLGPAQVAKLGEAPEYGRSKSWARTL